MSFTLFLDFLCLIKQVSLESLCNPWRPSCTRKRRHPCKRQVILPTKQIGWRQKHKRHSQIHFSKLQDKISKVNSRQQVYSSKLISSDFCLKNGRAKMVKSSQIIVLFGMTVWRSSRSRVYEKNEQGHGLNHENLK